ncbi:MAG: hypothetical protein EOM55_01965 [Clostridia bacterium]|nr:hypothetical protein [Clostridia bacterium]
MSCFFACGEEYVTSVSASLPSNVSMVEERGRYYLEYSTTPIQLDITLTPSKFSIRNLNWSTTASNIAYVNNDGKFVMAGGSGDVNIQATYVNENGTTVSSVLLKFNISIDPFPCFANETATGIYLGIDIKNNYVVQNAKPQTYEYVYYYIGDDNDSEVVQSIVNAGEYLITYVRSASQTKFSEMRLTVEKYTIDKTSVKTSPNCTSVYADSTLPTGFFSTTPTDEQFSNGFDLTDGVGRDAGKVIGKYLYMTNAKTTSNVGTYVTNIVYELGDEYEKNYELTSISGIHTITPKQVVLSIENQIITYGETINSNNYYLYGYEQYTLNGDSIEGLTALTNEMYTRRINTGDYVKLQNDIVVVNNVWGYIDAGIYILNYDSNLISTDGNVEIKELLSGILTVNKKEIVISPNSNNSKFYTEEDDYASLEYSYSGVISNINEIVPFLTINYQGLDYGTMNFKAPVGSYLYGIDNTLNKNFIFSLTEHALAAYDEEDQILFEVKPCPVVIKFDNIVEYYEMPNGYDENNNVVPTVSYYSVMTNNSIPNYELDAILSLKINGQEQVVDGVCTCALNDFSNNGSFEFSTGEIFKISLKLISQATVGSHYATYYVALQTSISTEVLNYSITVEKSYVYLDKINITVIPNETNNISSKVYSQDGSISNLFYSDYTISGEMENNVEVSNVLGTELILSLTDRNGLFYMKQSNGTLTAVENLSNCGRYKIFLSSNLSYSSGKEYYNFTLDNSKEYFYTVTQRPIVITPNDGQGKIYGDSDSVLTFIYGDSISNLPVTGSLVRASGENAGSYEISLGTLSFGSNYTLSLNPIVKHFTISKRDITITPISYTTTYGDNYPTTIGYNDPLAGQSYNASILVRPTFTGEFKLYYGESETAISKVGNFYPVKVVGGQVVAYTIKQGTFLCQNNNYEMTVVGTSTYLVNKKEATLNIIAENKSSTDGISSTFSNFTNYTLIGENGTESVTISGISFTATFGDDKYYIDGIEDISSLLIQKDGIDVTQCYNISLGQSIVYYIASTIVNLSIVGVDDETSSLVKVTYSGEEVANKFKLICTTAGFEINEGESNYEITYSTNTTQDVTPLNAGSYYVSLNVGINNKIVITNTSNSEDIEFSALGVKVSSCVLNLSQFAYLNISQADISYIANYLGFESALTYGSDESALSNIRTTYDDGGVTKSIFTGVNDEFIELKTYGNGKNFVFTSSPQSVRTLNASASVTYSIKVTIQAIKTGTSDLDANYKSLTIDVKLTVVPSEIILEGSTSLEYKGSYSQQGAIVYSGHASIFSLEVATSTSDAIYSNSYTYEGIETFYNNSVEGYVEVFSYSGGIVSSTSNTKLASDLSISTIELVTYSGDNYYLINKETDAYCIKIKTQDATPKDAGVYLCIATCTAGDNFVFDGNLKSVNYYEFFEIERSNDILINDWKSEFRWGTTFNLEDPSSLPFSYSMLPDFKSKVIYLVENEEDWEAVSYVLSVNPSYLITLLIDERNYYISSNQTFAVTSREAQIVFPTRTKYGFKGENQPIDLFLEDIVAILKDQNGVPIDEKKYINYSANFTLIYKTETDTVLQSAPWDAGNYVLTVNYGTTSSNYYGEGTFAYTIEKSAFTGEIIISNYEIEYDPSITAEVLYNILIGNMFYIENGWDYTLTVKNEAGKIISTSNENGWLSTINSISVKKIVFTVTFNETNTISDYIASAYLTITARKIKDSNFNVPSNDIQYSYSGNAFYNELIYNTVNIAPKTINSSVVFPVGSSTYKVVTLSYNSIKLLDCLDNELFTLTYNYSYQSAVGSSTYVSMSSAPIASKTVNYKVVYVFSNFGNNYSNKLASNTITRYFKINKVSTLYISIFDDADDNYDTSIIRQYSGDDFYDIFSIGNLLNIVSVSNSSDIKDNINKTIFKTTSARTYSSLGGIHLVVFFTDENGVVVEDLTNAGSYFLNISFLRNSNYSVSEFFEYIVFNATTNYATSTAFNSSNSYFIDANARVFTDIYETYFSIPLTIMQADCPYDSSNFGELITITNGNFIITTDPSELYPTTVFVFEAGTTFSLPVGTPFSLVFETYINGSYLEMQDTTNFYSQGEYYFSNLTVGMDYSIMIVDVNGNYKNSQHIRFRVETT